MEQTRRYDDIFKGDTDGVRISRNIAANFSNADAVLKSEAELKLEDELTKGEITEITAEEVITKHAGKFYLPQKVGEFQKTLDDLVEKGETDFLSEDEFAMVEKGKTDIESLERRVIRVPHAGRTKLVEILVKAEASAEISGDEQEEEEEETEDSKSKGKK